MYRRGANRLTTCRPILERRERTLLVHLTATGSGPPHQMMTHSRGATTCPAAGATAAAGSSTVACACGNVELKFHVPRPRNRIACCCWDCRQKCRWAESEGGPKLPANVVSYDAPMDLIYFPNSFELTKGGLDDIEFCTLRDDDGSISAKGWRGDKGSINMVTNCCKTTLLVDNVNYHASKDIDNHDGAQVLLFPAVLQLQTEMIDMRTTINFIEDYPEEKAEALKAKFLGSDPPVCRRPHFKKEFSLRLFRACLGKYSVLSIKWRNKPFSNRRSCRAEHQTLPAHRLACTRCIPCLATTDG
jgi:hypothetical protein